MPPICSAPNCFNSSRDGFALVNFPKNQWQRTKWIQAMGRDGWTPKPSDRICEVHFKPSDWTDFRKLLRRSAVPSVFCVCQPNDTSEEIFKELRRRRTRCIYSPKTVHEMNRVCCKSVAKQTAPLGCFSCPRTSAPSKSISGDRHAQLMKQEETLLKDQSELLNLYESLEIEARALDEILLWQQMEQEELMCVF
ncbi:hypothetical protein ONE63_008058 [Megalurothrips usitatus]|uniref:THAP-type domain-containing protein n=1 Tax=Megalurothrips usitatus TaxID=439358 RepID=A0AAV7XX76_9NEOP|nr:hypothetical protein ONE63_008058 [Megalurothrips usitatus]